MQPINILWVDYASSIDTGSNWQPVHVSRPTENRILIPKGRRQEFRPRRPGPGRTYRRGRNPVALRIGNESSNAQDQRGHTHDNKPFLVDLSCNHRRETPLGHNQALPKPQEQYGHSHDIDREAASLVDQCFKQHRESRSGRTLRKRLNHELDLGLSSIIQSLNAIRDAADKVFFSGKLRNRVEWRWSSKSDQGFENEFVGTTTPSYSEEFGTNVEIVLSSPLLRSKQYSSNLLLSTFLHELVHGYLFIVCGSRAEEDGGHTPGFQRIVSLIQSWLGNSRLRLCSMRADLDDFLPDDHPDAEEREPEDDWCMVDSVYSEFSNSPGWAADSDIYVGTGDEDVQPVFTRSLTTSACQSGWQELPPPGWVEVGWADTPRMGYVSRQELAGAIEGSASMPILVE